MKFINVRHLLNNFKEATSELPVSVTVYGKPLFVIYSIKNIPSGDIELDAFKSEWTSIKEQKESLKRTPSESSKKILEKKIVEPVMKVDPSDALARAANEGVGFNMKFHVCSWDRTFKCTSPGTVFVKGKWWCTPHGLEVK